LSQHKVDCALVAGDVSRTLCLPSGRRRIATTPELNMNNELAITIGRAARQARHALGLTQEQVTEKLDLSLEFLLAH
jgi:hypothetical protein